MTSPHKTLLHLRLTTLADFVYVRETAHGRGLFAARAFDEGAEIFSEACLFACAPRYAADLNRAAAVCRARVPGRPHARAAMPQALALPFAVGAIVSSAELADDASALDDLAPLCGAPQKGRGVCPLRISDVLRKNGAEADFGEIGTLTCVLLVLSMVNHACDPNAGWRSSWDSSAGVPRFSVRAAKRIERNAEINFSYVPVDAARAVRRARLRAGWGFECACARCLSCGDDATAVVCSICSGPVRCDATSPGCASCNASWPACGFESSAAARSTRDDAIWFLGHEGDLRRDCTRLRDALKIVHPTDAEFRATLRALLADAFAPDAQSPCGGCALEGLVLTARAVRDGTVDCSWLSSPLQVIAAELTLADAAALAAAVASEGCCTRCVECEGQGRAIAASAASESANKWLVTAATSYAAAAQKATLCFTSEDESFIELLVAAAACPPLTRGELYKLRRSRDEALESASIRATVHINDADFKRLFGEP
jgi:hypothetical protein